MRDVVNLAVVAQWNVNLDNRFSITFNGIVTFKLTFMIYEILKSLENDLHFKHFTAVQYLKMLWFNLF